MTKYLIVLTIIDITSAKSDVNDGKYVFCNLELESDKTHKRSF